MKKKKLEKSTVAPKLRYFPWVQIEKMCGLMVFKILPDPNKFIDFLMRKMPDSMIYLK